MEEKKNQATGLEMEITATQAGLGQATPLAALQALPSAPGRDS